MGFRNEQLTEQERFVWANRPMKTYRNIAQELGVSPERVRQIFNKAERKLREKEKKHTTDKLSNNAIIKLSKPKISNS